MFSLARWADGSRIAVATFLIGVLATLFYVELLPARSRETEVLETGKTENPVAPLAFHGDVRFTSAQRAAIEAGLKDVNRTSCGFVKASIVWDVESFLPHALLGENLIMSSSTEELVRFRGPDAEFLLGMTLNAGIKWIFLVTPKLGDDVMLWEWVVAHEATHAAGMMEHVRTGLMEPEAPWAVVDKPEWEREDIALFCKRWRCDPQMFRSCRYR